MSPARTHRLALAAVVALAIATHAATLVNGFVWDDTAIVVEHPATRDLARLGDVLLAPDETAPYYRPLNRASYLVDHALFGMTPAAFHAVNVALHAAAVAALFILVGRLGGSLAAATSAAALFAVHPVSTEAIAFVTARNNLFAALFALASVSAFVTARAADSRRASWASAVLFFLGTLAKEQALMALPLMAILAVTRPDADRWRAVRRLGPHAIALAAYLMLRLAALSGAAPPPIAASSLADRLAMNVTALPRYLALVVFPRDLTVLHAPPRLDDLSPAILAAVWLAIAAAAWGLARSRRPLALFGALWFALNYVPLAGLLPIPSAFFAERYFYVPAIGLWIVAGDLAGAAFARARWRVPLAVLGVVVLALGAARSVARHRDWRDEVTLFSSAVRVDPLSVEALYDLGVALKDRGDLPGARRAWERAVAIEPADAASLTQLGTAAAVDGDLAEAERLLRRALRQDARQPVALYNLGLVCERTGRASEAIALFEAVAALPPPNDAGFAADAGLRARALRSSR